jgi:NAD+ synthase
MAEERGVYRSPVVRAFRVSAGMNRIVMSLRKRFLSSRVAERAPGRARQKSSHTVGPAVHAVLAPLASSLNRLFAGFATRHILRREILEEYAAGHNLLLVGAANRTEAFTGWFVRDGVDDLPIEPILGLYKNQVVRLARYLGVPDEIVTAPPSPDMLKGVGDETMIGFSYDTLDRVAYVVEHGLDSQRAFNDGVSENDFAGICALHEKTGEKRTSHHEFPSFD